MKQSIIARAFLLPFAMASVTPEASAQQRDVRVVNKTHRIMRALHAANPGSEAWGKDLLGSGMLRTGRETVVSVPHGRACLIDLRATFTGDIKLVRRNVPICRVRSWTITK